MSFCVVQYKNRPRSTLLMESDFPTSLGNLVLALQETGAIVSLTWPHVNTWTCERRPKAPLAGSPNPLPPYRPERRVDE